ncbi:MAG TPA: phosphoglycerate kinase [Deltaproteobacteria bacterium]|nr:phosphoglycerate kinase [Candidatus Binatota bacterium]HIL12985.1 phosphoglycerate kinase [Deltaproteobacteria bacterium]
MRRLEQLELAGRRVFLRVDFNVPLRDGVIANAVRVENALPTIKALRDAGARVILASHLGRPGGKADPACSLAPVAELLSGLLETPVPLAPDCVGEQARAMAMALADGEVLLLENLRFHDGEKNNAPAFAAELASLAELYVNDAFGAVHRAHASIVGVPALLPEHAAGLLLTREVEALSMLVESPAQPFVAVVGGAKVSDKIAVMKNLLGPADSVLVGGAMAYTFLAAMGHSTGDSRVESDKTELAAQLLDEATRAGCELQLPVDHVAADNFDENATPVAIDSRDIPDGLMGLDIGPRSRRAYQDAIAGARTLLWNGPMGVFEWPAFAEGTMAVANAVADSAAMSVVGGGDSVAALTESGRQDDVTHVSTGGGASLEFLEGRTLPGIAALDDENDHA